MNDGAYWSSNNTFDNFMSDLALPTGARPVITVNYGSNRHQQRPVVAQQGRLMGPICQCHQQLWHRLLGDWQRNVRQRVLTGWNWEYDLHDLDQTAADRVGNSALSPTAYGTNAAAFVQAMKAVDPSIKWVYR